MIADRYKLVFVGLSITSSWGNGHATTYRSLLRGLAQLGHSVHFLERNLPWYAENRDLPAPPYCKVGLYDDLESLKEKYRETMLEADLVVIGSYVPQGAELAQWILELRDRRKLTAFYDIDTPVTLQQLRDRKCEYLRADQVSQFPIYLSFSGGAALKVLREEFGSPHAIAFYCSVDPSQYSQAVATKRWNLGYLGTFSPDRQSALEALLLDTASKWGAGNFVVAGPGYQTDSWSSNVTYFPHLSPEHHRYFYHAQSATLNLTRHAMLELGHSPSVRLFEAGACGTAILSDAWEGISEFFEPDEEILLVSSGNEVKRILRDVSPNDLAAIGSRAAERVRCQHTSVHRAQQLIDLLTHERNISHGTFRYAHGQ